jgi:hypothetical protein
MIKTAEDAYLAGRQAAMQKLAFLDEYRRKPGERPPLKDSAIYAGKVGGGLGLMGLGAYGSASGIGEALMGARPLRRGLPLMVAGGLGLAAGKYLLGSAKKNIK